VSTTTTKRRGPSRSGACSTRYVLAVNLWNTANNHKAHCDENCNVSLTRIEEAAKLLMRDAPLMSEIEDFLEWEWPY
jgi:hypothetical protein